MAIVSVGSSSNHMQMEAIPLVDLCLLSQSELNLLSLCSDEAFDLGRCDDVVIPKIDRSVFNESAGSRKQTYSRLRLAPRKPEITNVGRRRRSAGLLPLPKPPPNPVDDPERKENQRIATLLRELFLRDNSVKPDLIPIVSEHRELQPVPLKVDNGVSLQQLPVVVACKEVKKRGRKRKHEQKSPQVQGDGNGNVMSNAIVVYEDHSNFKGHQTMEILNRNGVAVDIAALANLQDPFGPELRSRTVGLETEEALLGFLRQLNGQWGSRRKKRKIVDASDFGDALPKGWKLMLGIKRRVGSVWLNCRRYISPSGHQFVTCKDVSSFLLSYFGAQDLGQQNYGHKDSTEQTQKLAFENIAGLTREDDSKAGPMCYSMSQMVYQSNDHEKQVALLGVENLAEVQIRDLLECHKCNLTFQEKDAYLQHLLSSHQKSAKRCKVGTSITDGVIIKDGKYECQFCHKIFEERHRYTGHVGVHVRNYVKNLDALPSPMNVQKSIAPPSLGTVTSGAHMMDSSVYINKGSIPVTSTAKTNDQMNVGSVHCKLDENYTYKVHGDSNFKGLISSTDNKQVKEAPNVHSLHAIVKTATVLETPASRSILHVNSSHGGKVEEAYKDSTPETAVATMGDGQNLSSFCSKQDPASTLQPVSGEPKFELHVASFQENLVKEAKNECSSEITIAKPNDEQNDDSFCTKIEEISVQETPVDESNIQHGVPSCHSKLITNASKYSVSGGEPFDGNTDGALYNKQDKSSGDKSNCNLNANSSHNKHDMETCKFEQTLVEKSSDKLFCDSSTSDSKAGITGEANYVGNDKINHCMDSGTALSNKEGCSSSHTSGGNDSSAFTSIKNDKSGTELEMPFERSSLIPDNEKICGLEGNMNEVLTSFTKVPKLDDMKKPGNNELESSSGNFEAKPNKDIITKTNWTSDEGNGPVNRVADSFSLTPSASSNDELGNGVSGFGGYEDLQMETTHAADEGHVPDGALVNNASFPLMHSSGCFPDPNMTSNKGADECCNGKMLESTSGVQELRLEDIEPSKFTFITQQESRSVAEESMAFAYHAASEQGFDSAVQFEWEAVYPRMAGTNQLTTVCMWCRIEFNNEAVDALAESDSHGFMCSACKDKTSSQANVVDAGFPVNSDKL